MATDDLIAALCAGGRVDSHGEFTLDRDEAREKLRTFQVAEPHRYVLHLVALAALRRATAIAFEIDSDDLWARFDGLPLTEQDFEDLYSSSFSATTSDAERARQQLAVGLNAALALNPRHVRVTSGPAGQRVRLEATHGADDVIARMPDDAGEGTVIHVKQRFRAGLAVRFWRLVRGDMPEVTALRERAAYAAIALTVNGERLAAAAAAPSLAQVKREVDLEGRTCVAGLRKDPEAPAEVRLVRHEVWISTLHPTHLPGGTIAVVRDDTLQTDLSGQEVVHDKRRDRCLILVDRAVEAVLHAHLVERGPEVDPWLRQRLRRAFREWPRMRDPTSPLGVAAAALPWWSDIFGRPVTLAALRTCLESHAAVFYTASEFADRLESFPDLVIAVPANEAGEPSEELLLLRDLFGVRLRDRTRELEREVRRAGKRRLWRARPAVAALEPERYSVLAPIRVEAATCTIEGQVGLRRDPRGPSTVRVIVEGHLLCELSVGLPLAIDAVIAGLATDEEFDGPPHDDRSALALLALLDAALWMIEDEMSGRTSHQIDIEARATARRWLQLRFDPDGPRRWLQEFGFRAGQAEQGLAQPAVAGLPRICRARAEVPTARLLEPWLAECERLPTVCGRSLSLGALALALSRGDRVVWTAERVPVLAGLDRIVLCLDEAAQALVSHVFADRIVRLDAAELRALVAEQRFMAQPEEEPTLAVGSCGVQVRVEDGPLKAVLGVRFFRDGEPLRAPVRVLVRGRKLDDRAVWAPFAGVVAVVRDDRLTPTSEWTGVVDDAAWAVVERALLEALPRLVAEALRLTPLGLIGDVLAASFPSPALRRAWERLVEVEGETAGEGAYALLLGLTSQVPLAQLDQAIERALRQPPRLVGERRVHAIGNIAKIADGLGVALDPARARMIEAVLRESRIHCGQHRPGAPLGQQVVAGQEPAFHELTLRRADGVAVSLAELIAQRTRGEKIEILRAAPIGGPGPRPHAVVVTDAEDALLLRLFGSGAIRRVLPVGEPAAELRPTALPAAPADALARVFVRGSDVAGELWMPAGAEEEDCRVGLHAADGALQKRVSLMPPLPLAGALTGSGVRAEGFRVEMSLVALAAIRDAALRLYEDLLGRGDPAALLAVRRVHGRIGEARLPPPLVPLRERLRAIAGVAQHEAPPAPPTLVPDVLEGMFDELETEARRHTKSSTRAPEARPIVPTRQDLPPAPPTPETRLLVAIRLELRSLRDKHERLLSNFNLDHLRMIALGPRVDAVTIGPEAVVLNRSHPLIQRAAAECERDPWWVDVLASLVFTAFNVWREEITDADEQAFHRSHLERVVRRTVGRG